MYCIYVLNMYAKDSTALILQQKILSLCCYFKKDQETNARLLWWVIRVCVLKKQSLTTTYLLTKGIKLTVMGDLLEILQYTQ